MIASVLGSVEEQPQFRSTLAIVELQLSVSPAVVKLQIVAKRGNPVLSFPLLPLPFAPVSSALFASDLMAFVALG